MFEFRQIRPSGGDGTAPYEIILDRTYTVETFISTVLSQRNKEWGRICVRVSSTSIDYCDYRDGRLLSEINSDLLNKEIISVIAAGGWTCMDYSIQIAEPTIFGRIASFFKSSVRR